MLALTSRTRSRQRLTPSRSHAQPNNTENMEGDDNQDRKLHPNVQLKVVMKKLSKNDLEKWKFFTGGQSSPKRNRTQNVSGVTMKSMPKSKVRKTRSAVPKLTTTFKNIADELRYLLLKCDPNCKHCEKYILKLTQHIQSIHTQNTNDVDEHFFQSPISSVPEENDQESSSQAPPDMGVDLDPNLNLSQDSDSQSRTLVIRNTKVIYYVEEMNEKDLGQIQIPLTSEGQPSASTSTSFQNCLKNDSTEFEFVHIRDDKKVKSNSEQVEQMVNPLTSVGDQNSDSDSDHADVDNFSDPDFVGDGNDQDSNSDKNQENSNETNIFVCQICDETFGRKVDVQKHMMKSHATVKTHLNNHMSKIHTGEKNDTRRSHTGEKRNKCETCGKTYPTPYKLATHKRTHTGERPFKCSVCNATFASSGIFSRHLGIHGKKSHVCDNCGKEFHRLTDLRKHGLTHTREKPTEEKTEKVYNCKVCRKNFVNHRALANHKIIHTEKSQMCEHCGKYFHQKTDLRKHIRRVHTGEISIKPKIYKCDTCEKSYDAPGLLDVHIRTHTGEKPFMCEFCSMCFIGTKALRDHMKIHGEKSHICTHCRKGFYRRIHLTDHIKKIHTREYPYKCEVCEESFLLPKQFELHQRIHTGEKVYKCEVSDCGKYFPVLKLLTVHKKCHTQERQFPCPKCPKSFRLKSNLNIHLKIHAGDKPHKCDECGKCFTFLSKLAFHQKRKTNCSEPEPEPQQIQVEVLGI